MRPPLLLTVALLLGSGMLAAACGGSSGAASGPPRAQAGASPPLSTLPPPALPTPTAPPSQPTDLIEPITVAGRVAAGASPGCLVLVAGTVTWVLLGPPTSELVVGQHVQIGGRPAPELVTPCDGTALLVRTVRHT